MILFNLFLFAIFALISHAHKSCYDKMYDHDFPEVRYNTVSLLYVYTDYKDYIFMI